MANGMECLGCVPKSISGELFDQNPVDVVLVLCHPSTIAVHRLSRTTGRWLSRCFGGKFQM